MSRQLKISENTHSMLSLFKINKDTSFDSVIRMLIDNIDPVLAYEVERINKIYYDDPENWAEAMNDLHENLMDSFIIDFMSNEKERNEIIAEQMSDLWEQDAIDEAERESEGP